MFAALNYIAMTTKNYHWRIAGFYFFYYAFVGMFAPYWSLYLKSIHFDAIEIAILMSIQPVMRMVENENTPQVEQQETPSNPEPAAEPTGDSTPSMEDMLQEAERKAQEHYDAWMYAKAESENVRRRAAEDVSKAQKFAVERFSNEMLAVMDSLQAGLAVETENVDSFKSGMELTLKQLSGVFEKFNIKEINPVGEKLDPHHDQCRAQDAVV